MKKDSSIDEDILNNLHGLHKAPGELSMIDEQQYNEKKNEDEEDNESESSYDSQKTTEINFKGIVKEEDNY